MFGEETKVPNELNGLVIKDLERYPKCAVEEPVRVDVSANAMSSVELFELAVKDVLYLRSSVSEEGLIALSPGMKDLI